MKHLLLFAVAVVATAFASVASADEIITALDLRSTGVFGHADATAGVIDSDGSDGAVSFEVTYANLDIEGDGSANDTVNFIVQWTSPDTGLRLFGQGADEGFGDLSETTVSMLSVMGTTTDGGLQIVFDGFTGAAIGAGAGAGSDVDAGADINGVAATVFIADNGGFRFGTDSVDFAPTATVVFDNSFANSSSIVGRNYDLQFSAVPEPTSMAVVGLLGSLIAIRRRK